MFDVGFCVCCLAVLRLFGYVVRWLVYRVFVLIFTVVNTFRLLCVCRECCVFICCVGHCKMPCGRHAGSQSVAVLKARVRVSDSTSELWMSLWGTVAERLIDMEIEDIDMAYRTQNSAVTLLYSFLLLRAYSGGIGSVVMFVWVCCLCSHPQWALWLVWLLTFNVLIPFSMCCRFL